VLVSEIIYLVFVIIYSDFRLCGCVFRSAYADMLHDTERVKFSIYFSTVGDGYLS